MPPGRVAQGQRGELVSPDCPGHVPRSPPAPSLPLPLELSVEGGGLSLCCVVVRSSFLYQPGGCLPTRFLTIFCCGDLQVFPFLIDSQCSGDLRALTVYPE